MRLVREGTFPTNWLAIARRGSLPTYNRYEDFRKEAVVALKVGDRAPDFQLPAVEGEQRSEFRLQDYLGKQYVVVTFHPLDWTPTCESQLPILDSLHTKFAEAGGKLLDISVDSIESHVAWQRKEIGMMRFPLCSDFYPHGEVTRKFGILREEPPVPGISERAAFIVDKQGVIQFAKVYPIDQLPDIEGLLAELTKISGRDGHGY